MAFKSMSDSTVSHEKSQVASYDERLQAARALDWRFLLPSPRMSRVLLSTRDTVLSQSIITTCEQLVSFEDDLPIHDIFPLVICSGMDRPLIGQIAPRVAPGGTLVILSDTSNRRGKWARWRGVPLRRQRQELGGTLAQAGTFTLRAWWHSPNRSQCKTLVPLDDRHAVTLYLRSHWPAPPMSGLASVASRLLCAGVLIRDVTWLAQRVAT